MKSKSATVLMTIIENGGSPRQGTSRAQPKFVMTLLAAFFGVTSAAMAAEPPARPNFLVILLDDQRFDDLGCAGHPFVKTPHIDRLAHEGAMFQNAFTPSPLCSPSRACFFSGQYAHKHRIINNRENEADRNQLEPLTFFHEYLHGAGYETALIGKWHMGLDDSPRRGFDYWVSVKGTADFVDPLINDNGRRRKVTGYGTDVFTDLAVAFLEREHEKPFFLWFAHRAVHPNLEQIADGSVPPGTPHAEVPQADGRDIRLYADGDLPVGTAHTADKFVPAERHRRLYADEPIPRRPNVEAAAESLAGKPALRRDISNLPPLGTMTGTDDESIRNRLRMLMAVDEGVGRILQTLEQTGELDKTLILFASDHGYFYGEHGLSVERRLAYEESSRVPLLVRYPPLVPAGNRPEELVLTIDVAPTLLHLAGIPIPEQLQGRSLVPLLKGERPADWRKSVVIEHFSDVFWPRMYNMGYESVRTDRYKFIRYKDLQGMDELYDLQTDPYEINNVIDSPRYQSVLGDLQAELDRLLAETSYTARAGD